MSIRKAIKETTNLSFYSHISELRVGYIFDQFDNKPQHYSIFNRLLGTLGIHVKSRVQLILPKIHMIRSPIGSLRI